MKVTIFRKWAFLLVLVEAGVWAQVGRCKGLSIRTIALSGEHAPGTDQNVVFSGFNVPALNAHGETAFKARLWGGDVDFHVNGHGIWSEGERSLSLLVRKGDAAVGLASGYRFNELLYNQRETPVLSNYGQVAFGATATRPGTDGHYGGLWVVRDGQLSPMALVGEVVPGIPEAKTYRWAEAPMINARGEYAFWARIVADSKFDSSDEGLWSGNLGSLRLRLRTNHQAAGFGSEVIFDRFTVRPSFNAGGMMGVVGEVEGGDSFFPMNQGVWLVDADHVKAVAVSGQPAPGFGENVVLNNFGPLAIDGRGNGVFTSYLIGESVTEETQQAIWTHRDDALMLLARGGNPAPGTRTGEVYNIVSEGGTSRKFREPVINRDGVIAYTAHLVGPDVNRSNDRGLWVEDHGEHRLLVREGDPVPDMGADYVVAGIGRPLINGPGQVAMLGSYGGIPERHDVSTDALWATDRNGVIRTIAWGGQLIDVSDDPNVQDFRTIYDIEMLIPTGNEDGGPANFNDRGELAFKLEFTDGSEGLFVATVPEPAISSLMLVGMALLQRRPGEHR